MNDTDQIKLLLSLFAIQLPTLLVCFVAGVVILGRWKQGSKGSMWALLRFGLAAVLCFAVPVADCFARLDQAQWPHDGRECTGNGRLFDRVVSAARCHLRFALDSGICRTLDLGSSIYASLIQIRTPIKPNPYERVSKCGGLASLVVCFQPRKLSGCLSPATAII